MGSLKSDQPDREREMKTRTHVKAGEMEKIEKVQKEKVEKVTKVPK